MRSLVSIVLLFACIPLAHAGSAKGKKGAEALWEKECGACHVAFPTKLLTVDDWKKIMGGLADHFGVNAELYANERKQITDYLVNHSGNEARHHSDTLRITKTPWFRKEHRSISPKEWVLPEVMTPSNCKACHQIVGHESWAERDINKYGKVRYEDDD